MVIFFKACEEVVEAYKDFKGSTTGFLMPHSGRIKKIVVEGLFFMNVLKFTQEVEDELVKSGIIDEKELTNFNEHVEKTKEKLKKEEKKIGFLPKIQNARFFKIVKFEKKN